MLQIQLAFSTFLLLAFILQKTDWVIKNWYFYILNPSYRKSKRIYTGGLFKAIRISQKSLKIWWLYRNHTDILPSFTFGYFMRIYMVILLKKSFSSFSEMKNYGNKKVSTFYFSGGNFLILMKWSSFVQKAGSCFEIFFSPPIWNTSWACFLWRAITVTWMSTYKGWIKSN